MNVGEIYSVDFSVSLATAIERSTPVSNFLSAAFFPKQESILTDFAAVEYKRQGVQIAPYIVKNTRGLNMARERSKVSWYRVPRFGARRVIGLGDLELRQFGEVPEIYNAVRPEERFARMQARDLADLIRAHNNRRAVMASEILFTGKVAMKAYADDGQVTVDDVIEFDGFNEVVPAVHWDDEKADIYGDLYAVSEKIQESAGVVPTLCIIGKNVERYLLQNKQVREWLMMPSRENLLVASLEPHWKNPQVRYVGRIHALNLELYSYTQSYIDENGAKRYLVPEDTALVGVPGNGKEIHAPVTVFQEGRWNTISASYVPVYGHNDDSQTTSLTVYSRFLLVPETLDDWYTIRTCGDES